MVRVVVVEDEPAARARIAAIAGSFPDLTLVAECADGASAVEAVLEHRPDLVLLDIQLPELDGFEVIAALAGEHLPSVVFITAHDEFAVRAFDAEAVDYVLKPFTTARLRRALERAIARLRTPGGALQGETLRAVAAGAAGATPLTRFVVRIGRELRFVPVAAVDWIEVADNYLRLHAGGRAHLVRSTLTEVMARLDPATYRRIHRGTVVNVGRITAIEHTGPGVYRLTMADGARLTSSRSYSATVRGLRG
jgi:two-component system LytT family response regulator